MELEDAIKLLNLSDFTTPIGVRKFTVRREDGTVVIVNFDDAIKSIAHHQEVLDQLVIASQQGYIAGTQWYHRQHKSAWEAVAPLLESAENTAS